MLMRGAATLGLARHDIHWTNSVLCGPLRGAAVLDEARKRCAVRLRAEVAGATAAGAPIVPLGALALRSVLGARRKLGILAYRGHVVIVDPRTGVEAPIAWPEGKRAELPEGALVLPTLHPAFVMRAERWRHVLESDFRRIARIMRHGYKPPECGATWHLATTPKQVKAQLARMGSTVCVDVETVGLGATTTALVCVGFSDGKRTTVIPWSRDLAGKVPWCSSTAQAAIVRNINQALRQRVTLTHNGPAFDHVVLARYGVRHAAWADSLLGMHAVRGHMPKGLGHLVSCALDTPPWKRWAHDSITELWSYNARDVLYNALAWAPLKGELAA
jgi:uracil-DNA glycosylase